jgi:hypothetical protein
MIPQMSKKFFAPISHRDHTLQFTTISMLFHPIKYLIQPVNFSPYFTIRQSFEDLTKLKKLKKLSHHALTYGHTRATRAGAPRDVKLF